jgi:hypothetical protein
VPAFHSRFIKAGRGHHGIHPEGDRKAVLLPRHWRCTGRGGRDGSRPERTREREDGHRVWLASFTREVSKFRLLTCEPNVRTNCARSPCEGWRKSFWDCRVSNRIRCGALITAAHQNCTIRSLSVELNVANLTREKKKKSKNKAFGRTFTSEHTINHPAHRNILHRPPHQLPPPSHAPASEPPLTHQNTHSLAHTYAFASESRNEDVVDEPVDRPADPPAHPDSPHTTSTSLGGH